ncbi:MAG: hypothetical protein KME16_15845 [Scytolyngbya sp. HA4215-MV1]|jgi:hypothetical protein|nr:hypothetical protein [Scytolyngbya sp. HA4215-MV1]
MPVKKSHYEVLLAEYTNRESAISLLKQHRPYLEMIPSMRRSQESVITIPLPIVRIRGTASANHHSSITVTPLETVSIPCDVAILMCDPEWKIKTGVEIFIFIHRPEEDFSDLLSRWRYTQVLLGKGYEWVMPSRYKYVLSEEAESTYPLFVVFDETPDRIKRGLKGAYLPFVTHSLDPHLGEEDPPETSSAEGLVLEE